MLVLEEVNFWRLKWLLTLILVADVLILVKGPSHALLPWLSLASERTKPGQLMAFVVVTPYLAVMFSRVAMTLNSWDDVMFK